MPTTTHRLIRNTPAAPLLARRYVGAELAGAPPEVVDAAELMVSELATNCVRHVRHDFTVTVERTARRVRVDVADDGPGGVELRHPGPSEPSGRGLRIVDMLSDSWGVDEGSGAGTRVWFTLGLGPT